MGDPEIINISEWIRKGKEEKDTKEIQKKHLILIPKTPVTEILFDVKNHCFINPYAEEDNCDDSEESIVNPSID
ncbi:MAG TPA: hypothetical protein VNX68_04350 [Nitrosopumilaceae archaeon]|nr:hypothetical protein [Nitrosopumilaceae archaeon]